MSSDAVGPAIALVTAYREARLEGRYEELLALCTDDIVIDSQRDGQFRGHKEVLGYLETTPVQGVWEAPEQLSELQVQVRGTITAFFMKWPVVATYELCPWKDQGLRIAKISIKCSS